MRFDVVIVGASAAGLYAAELLARSGKKIAVFERQHDFEPPRRTLIVTSAVRKLLNPIPPQVELHRVGVMGVASPKLSTKIPLSQPDPVVERAELARWLCRRVQSAGGEVFWSYRFNGFAESNGYLGARFRAADKDVVVRATEAVVGADGVFSEVAAASGMSRVPRVPVLQAEVRLPENWDPSLTQVWFDTNDTRFFYWLIPESAERGVAGLIGDQTAPLGPVLKDFLLRHNLRPEVYQAAQVAMHHPRLRPWTRIGRIPVYLVGDAAGQVKVTTVGGTVTGLAGARAVARAVLNGTSYAQELRALKRELDVHWVIRTLLDRLDNRGYDCLLGAISNGVQRFLGKHNRDSMASVFWRLPLIEPRLLGVALRCLRRTGPGKGESRVRNQ